MEPEEKRFRDIVDKLVAAHADVRFGKMMSSPGIKYRDKVFAFYHKKQMIFKLGTDFDPAAHQIQKYSLLSPFKSKPPLAGWFEIPYEHQARWQELAELALHQMIEQLG